MNQQAKERIAIDVQTERILQIIVPDIVPVTPPERCGDAVCAETIRSAGLTTITFAGSQRASQTCQAIRLGGRMVTDRQVRRLREQRMTGKTLAANAAQ